MKSEIIFKKTSKITSFVMQLDYILGNFNFWPYKGANKFYTLLRATVDLRLQNPFTGFYIGPKNLDIVYVVM